MIPTTRPATTFTSAIAFIVFILISTQSFAQGTANWRLEKMPADLETDYALSALPPHLRKDATVYLLDPEKGYYIGRQGSNGYICFIARTEWAWSEFRNDLVTHSHGKNVGAIEGRVEWYCRNLCKRAW